MFPIGNLVQQRVATPPKGPISSPAIYYGSQVSLLKYDQPPLNCCHPGSLFSKTIRQVQKGSVGRRQVIVAGVNFSRETTFSACKQGRSAGQERSDETRCLQCSAGIQCAIPACSSRLPLSAPREVIRASSVRGRP